MSTLDDRIGELIAEQQAVSSGITAQSRSVALGVLAIVWLLLGGTQVVLAAKFACFSKPLLWIAALAVIGLLLDFVQALAALIEIKLALRDSANAKKADDVGYEPDGALRKVSSSAFVLKLIAIFGSAVWLLTIILTALSG